MSTVYFVVIIYSKKIYHLKMNCQTSRLFIISSYVTVTVPLVPVDAVEGRTVKFPCDVSSPNPADKVYMVFWFKDDSGVPLYRYDFMVSFLIVLVIYTILCT